MATYQNARERKEISDFAYELYNFIGSKYVLSRKLFTTGVNYTTVQTDGSKLSKFNKDIGNAVLYSQYLLREYCYSFLNPLKGHMVKSKHFFNFCVSSAILHWIDLRENVFYKVLDAAAIFAEGILLISYEVNDSWNPNILPVLFTIFIENNLKTEFFEKGGWIKLKDVACEDYSYFKSPLKKCVTFNKSEYKRIFHDCELTTTLRNSPVVFPATDVMYCRLCIKPWDTAFLKMEIDSSFLSRLNPKVIDKCTRGEELYKIIKTVALKHTFGDSQPNKITASSRYFTYRLLGGEVVRNVSTCDDTSVLVDFKIRADEITFEGNASIRDMDFGGDSETFDSNICFDERNIVFNEKDLVPKEQLCDSEQTTSASQDNSLVSLNKSCTRGITSDASQIKLVDEVELFPSKEMSSSEEKYAAVEVKSASTEVNSVSEEKHSPSNEKSAYEQKYAASEEKLAAKMKSVSKEECFPEEECLPKKGCSDFEGECADFKEECADFKEECAGSKKYAAKKKSAAKKTVPEKKFTIKEMSACNEKSVFEEKSSMFENTELRLKEKTLMSIEKILVSMDKTLISARKSIISMEKKFIFNEKANISEEKDYILNKKELLSKQKAIIREEETIISKEKALISLKKDLISKEKALISIKKDLISKEKSISELKAFISREKASISKEKKFPF